MLAFLRFLSMLLVSTNLQRRLNLSACATMLESLRFWITTLQWLRLLTMRKRQIADNDEIQDKTNSTNINKFVAAVDNFDNINITGAAADNLDEIAVEIP
jgi:hypothetical protein